MKMAESFLRGQKTLWENEKLLVTSNFSLSHSVFKRHVLQTHKNQGLFGKGLRKTGLIENTLNALATLIASIGNLSSMFLEKLSQNSTLTFSISFVDSFKLFPFFNLCLLYITSFVTPSLSFFFSSFSDNVHFLSSLVSSCL